LIKSYLIPVSHTTDLLIIQATYCVNIEALNASAYPMKNLDLTATMTATATNYITP